METLDTQTWITLAGVVLLALIAVGVWFYIRKKQSQKQSLDNPKGAVLRAEQLVRELMAKRGYPMGDFERRAGDISVDHPDVVANYRSAQAIAVREQRGSADTEELRKAVVHYRALFDELLEVREPRQEIIAEKRVAARW